MAAEFKFFADRYPTGPGVYLMKDSRGRIIYVGKAKNLRRRLSSYFGSGTGHTEKTRALVARVRTVDILLTATEKEALLTEASLIKKHRPRYNVVLMDDKQYVLFRLDLHTEFPRLSLTRSVVRDGSAYYGPFTSAAAARTTWRLLGRVFPLRKCKDSVFRNRSRPCLYHQIGQCLGPCALDVDREAYHELVHRVELFLSGRTGELVGELRRRMKAASEAMEYERAAGLRDQIRAIEATVERQTVVLPGGGDMDVLGVGEAPGGLGLGALFVRDGRLLDEKGFFWPGLTLAEAPEVVESFLTQFYNTRKLIPPRVVTAHAPEGEATAELLGELRGARVAVSKPAGGVEKRLVDLARSVARRAGERTETITEKLRRALKLAEDPVRIECVDATHLGGADMRVGMVVFENGKRVGGESRLYAFPELEGSGDDYAALAAWVRRRLESGPPFADLVLIDGGLGQLSAVERALDQCVEEGCWALAAIAKGETRRAGELEDRIFRPGRRNPLPLRPGSAELLFLQRVRDAAHRYVIGRGRKARARTALKSELASLPGIGPKTARILWDRFASTDEMAAASLEDIRALPGVGPKRAARIHAALAGLTK